MIAPGGAKFLVLFATTKLLRMMVRSAVFTGSPGSIVVAMPITLPCT